MTWDFFSSFHNSPPISQVTTTLLLLVNKPWPLPHSVTSTVRIPFCPQRLQAAYWPMVTEGATATGPYSLTEKRQRRNSRLLHLNPKSHQKKIPELENLRSFQSFLDSFKNCSLFLRERGQQCDLVAPWAHWQKNELFFFRKNTKMNKKGPRIKRELQKWARGKRVVGPRHGFKIYPNAILLEVPQIPFLQSQRSRAWAWRDQMKWDVFLSLEQTIPYFVKTNDSSHGKAQKSPPCCALMSLTLSCFYVSWTFTVTETQCCCCCCC